MMVRSYINLNTEVKDGTYINFAKALKQQLLSVSYYLMMLLDDKLLIKYNIIIPSDHVLFNLPTGLEDATLAN